MHHSPSGPSLFARMADSLARARFRAAAVLGPLGTLAVLLRRMRILPLALTALVLGTAALATPMSSFVDDSSTAALPAPNEAGVRTLVPATGNGWTQDGAPAATSESHRKEKATADRARKAAEARQAAKQAKKAAKKAAAREAAEAAAAEAAAQAADAADAETSEAAAAETAESPAAGSPSATKSSPSASKASAADAPASKPASGASGGLEAQVLALVNEERADEGCRALAADPHLAAVARAHSEDMRDRRYFDHTTPEGLSPFDRAEEAGLSNARAENIARGQQTPAAVMDSWMHSSGHRANILDCELRTLGVGVATGSGGPWWTQLFGV